MDNKYTLCTLFDNFSAINCKFIEGQLCNLIKLTINNCIIWFDWVDIWPDHIFCTEFCYVILLSMLSGLSPLQFIT